MAKKPIRGHIGPCPCCRFADMEVRNDKNGHAYAYCPMCSAQVLTHGRPEREAPMLAHMRACNCSITEEKPAPQASPASHSVREAKTAPKPVPKAPAAAAPGAPAAPPGPAPAPAKAKASPFATLMG